MVLFRIALLLLIIIAGVVFAKDQSLEVFIVAHTQ